MSKFEWVTGRQLLYQSMGTRILVDNSGIDEEVTATLRLVAWWNDRIAVTTDEYRFQFVLGPDEQVCIVPAPVDVHAALRAEAERIKEEFADHDPKAFTQQVVAAASLHGGDGLTSCGGSCCEGFPRGERMDEEG